MSRLSWRSRGKQGPSIEARMKLKRSVEAEGKMQINKNRERNKRKKENALADIEWKNRI